MKSFTYQSCNNEAVLGVKKEFKQNPNDSSIKSKYESLIGDTYIAIENIEEALNDLNELQKLKALIDKEDTSFANVILGTSNRGNNDSCYRAYLTIDGKSIIEVRIANHYETKTSALEQSNNLSQFLYQVVLITDPPQPQQGDSITTTTTAANLKILTKGIISRNTSVEKLSRLLKSIHDYLISPNSEWEEAKPNKTIKPENKQYNNMNKKLIRLTEGDLHRIVKESVNRILKEGIDDKLQFIIDIVKDLGQVKLSDKCGKYYALLDDGDSVVALKFVGANGYGTVDIAKLKPQIIDVIYNDLYEDFGD